MILFKEESYRVIGACMEIHKYLGPGFLESVYQEALSHEMESRKIPFLQEVPIRINYKDCLLEKAFFADYLCFDKIVVELKAVENLHPIHEAQVINYLKGTGYKLGILVNFGEEELRYKRLVRF